MDDPILPLPSLQQLDAETLDKDAIIHANVLIDDIDGPDDVAPISIHASYE